jgi:hypothetical protein
MKKKGIVIIEKPLDSELLSPSQACNEFQIVGVIRSHVVKKFQGERKLKKEWELIFKEEGVN